jgi:hypothetical protein
MALSKIQPASMDLTANYAFTGTNSIAGVDYPEKKLATLTASSSATLSFTSSIDSTYNIYKFRFIEIHPATDAAHFLVNFRDGDSDFDATKTTSFFQAQHNEAGNDASLGYNTSGDLAQSTSGANLDRFLGADNDQCLNGELFLFDPSSTTFVKHFISRVVTAERNDYSQQAFLAGYNNVTAAIDGVQFSMSSGNIDSGTIEMYGIN